ncbi:hypothetical protein ACLKA7_004968 [Drosophila subpalustris]
MEREMRCQMRYYGAPALEISMEPSGRSGVAPPPNSPRGSEDSRGTEPHTLDMGPVQILSPVRVGADRERPDAARPAVGWAKLIGWPPQQHGSSKDSTESCPSRSWTVSRGHKVTLAAGPSWSAYGPAAEHSSSASDGTG